MKKSKIKEIILHSSTQTIIYALLYVDKIIHAVIRLYVVVGGTAGRVCFPRILPACSSLILIGVRGETGVKFVACGYGPGLLRVRQALHPGWLRFHGLTWHGEFKYFALQIALMLEEAL